MNRKNLLGSGGVELKKWYVMCQTSGHVTHACSNKKHAESHGLMHRAAVGCHNHMTGPCAALGGI